MNPLAEELNARIAEHSPDTLALLSERGRALYWPRGILFQTAQAREKAHRFDATIGEATEDGGPMALESITAQLAGVAPADALGLSLLSCGPRAYASPQCAAAQSGARRAA